MANHETESGRNGEQVEQPNVAKPGVRGRGVGNHMHGPKGKRLPGIRMAFATGGGKIGFGNRGTRVAGRKNVVNAVAACAIGYRLGAGLCSQPMVTVLITGNPVEWKTETRLELRVAVAARTGSSSNIRHIYGRLGISRRQDVVLAVAVGAGGGCRDPRGHRPAVDAVLVLIEGLLVAFATGGADIALRNRGARIGRRKDGVRSMAIIADGCLLSLTNGPRMDAGFIRLYGPGGSKQVLLRQLWIRVTVAAGRGKVLAVNGGVRRGGLEHFVGGSVAILATWRVCVALPTSSSMNAGSEFLNLARMASGAKRRAASGWISYLVRAAMARHAGRGTIRLSKRRMSAGSQLPGDFSVAGKARGRCAL